MAKETLNFKVELAGRDELALALETEGGRITGARLTGIGCPELLALLLEWRPRLAGDLKSLPLPEGNGHAEILMRELILKAKGEWVFPDREEELCHCRMVPTQKVDAAVVSGAHSVAAVSARTSAGTSCGTCRPDIESVLGYRLRKKA